MSETVELPRRLQTTAAKAVEVEVTVPVDIVSNRSHYSPETVARLEKQLGLIHINGYRLEAIRDLGMEFRNLGMLDFFKGGIAVTLDGLLQAIGYLKAIIEDESKKPSERKEAARQLAYISEKLIKLQVGAVKVDQTVVQAVMDADKTKRQSFQPGMRVTQSKSP